MWTMRSASMPSARLRSTSGKFRPSSAPLSAHLGALLPRLPNVVRARSGCLPHRFRCPIDVYLRACRGLAALFRSLSERLPRRFDHRPGSFRTRPEAHWTPFRTPPGAFPRSFDTLPGPFPASFRASNSFDGVCCFCCGLGGNWRFRRAGETRSLKTISIFQLFISRFVDQNRHGNCCWVKNLARHLRNQDAAYAAIDFEFGHMFRMVHVNMN